MNPNALRMARMAALSNMIKQPRMMPPVASPVMKPMGGMMAPPMQANAPVLPKPQGVGGPVGSIMPPLTTAKGMKESETKQIKPKGLPKAPK